MEFVTAGHTDTGIRKETNQDSFLIEQARYGNETILFAAVCDGMGGLAKGEVASASLIRKLSGWFCTDLPSLLQNGFSQDVLKESWKNLIGRVSEKLSEYGEKHRISLGTTCAAFLAYRNRGYLMNIGDSRIYLLSDRMYQLTVDQTWCQREVTAGRMTPEEAAVHPQRNVLLQCVGASGVIEPDFSIGDLSPGQCILLCSDGFTHMITPLEIYNALGPAPSASTSAEIKQNLIRLTDLAKKRRESDNITALLVKTV